MRFAWANPTRIKSIVRSGTYIPNQPCVHTYLMYAPLVIFVACQYADSERLKHIALIKRTRIELSVRVICSVWSILCGHVYRGHGFEQSCAPVWRYKKHNLYRTVGYPSHDGALVVWIVLQITIYGFQWNTRNISLHIRQHNCTYIIKLSNSKKIKFFDKTFTCLF